MKDFIPEGEMEGFRRVGTKQGMSIAVWGSPSLEEWVICQARTYDDNGREREG